MDPQALLLIRLQFRTQFAFQPSRCTSFSTDSTSVLGSCFRSFRRNTEREGMASVRGITEKMLSQLLRI